MTKVFMYSGQGSQYYQMGRALYESDKVFKYWMDKLDDYLVSDSGLSVVKHIYDRNNSIKSDFDNIIYSHPAVFMVEYALTRSLIDRGIFPDYVLGTSLGEYACCAVSEVLDYRECLELIALQAGFVEKLCCKGGMLAVFSNADLFLDIKKYEKSVCFSGENFDNHFVISGTAEGIGNVKSYLKNKGIMFSDLPVLYAFHSEFIDCVKEHFIRSLEGKVINKPLIPIISCESSSVLREIEDLSYFWNVVRNPINFKKTIMDFSKNNPDVFFIDAGPSGTLSTFTKYSSININKENIITILSPLKNGGDPDSCASYFKIADKKNNKEENVMKALVFPGQGSQVKGMGDGLFDEFSEYVRKADDILGYSIKELCINDPENNLSNTQYTQPALFIVSVLSYLKYIKENSIPDFTAGHSLGEYTALFASGVFDFETGVKLVKKRGELMSRAEGGSMAAVIGLDENKVKEILKDNNLGDIDIANYNSPFQIVISGEKEIIESSKGIFENAGAKMYAILKVSGAFHSRYMNDAKTEFTDYLDSFTFEEPKIPIIANFTARPYKSEEIKTMMAEQITGSVKWTETIRYLMGKGVSEFKEIGPGNVLTGLITKIKKEAEPLIVTDRAENYSKKISAEQLGNAEFKKDYKTKYAYMTGSMYKGVASKEMVVKMAKSGFLSFLGTGGVRIETTEESIKYIKKNLTNGEVFGLNLLNNIDNPQMEDKMVDMYIKYGIQVVEAAAYMQVSPSLVRYRLKGVSKGENGEYVFNNRVIAKVSRPEVALTFLSPAPERIISKLLDSNMITKEEAETARVIPMADDITVEADSGGHTDMGNVYTLLPAIMKLRDDCMKQFGYKKYIRVGTGGGIGTPEAAAASFVLGADYIVTGSINQCTVEAGNSDLVKDMLQDMNVQDTDYAPAGDMFEIGAKVQVLKKGVFFPARANKLYDLYRQYNSIEEIDEKTRIQIEEKYCKRSFNQIYEDCKSFYPKETIDKAEKNPKIKMALIFRWYFGHATRAAMTGDLSNKVDFQVHCGPSLGAFNQWVKGTDIENWRSRHVDDIAFRLLNSTADLLNERISKLIG